MSDLALNKQTVIDFYTTAFGGHPEDAVAAHVGNRYLQHNPQAKDGTEAFTDFVHYLLRENPDLHLDIKRVVAEGDIVVTHSELILTPGEPGQALADFFRLEAGKIVEHWDVVQDVAPTSANANTMF
jgi:predicted SnoaL-like aldol condensation-catalyzing enzyme